MLRVDTSDQNAANGRQSVRITSKDTWDNGLFIFDVIHTPYGCATWPALWLSDVPNWPEHGEIDVMENVNQATDGNIMSKFSLSHLFFEYLFLKFLAAILVSLDSFG